MTTYHPPTKIVCRHCGARLTDCECQQASVYTVADAAHGDGLATIRRIINQGTVDDND